MTEEGVGASERVRSVDRVFQLLEHLADDGGSRSLSELTRLTGLPMPTIHRLLRSLINDGYVRQESSKRYALGPRMIRLGESASRTLGSWAMPHLAQVVAKCGETANMAMLEGDACDAVAALREEPNGDLVVLGSGELTRSLMRRGLVDEFVLLIHPLVLGQGRRLFAAEGERAALRLLDSVPTSTGVVICSYATEEERA